MTCLCQTYRAATTCYSYCCIFVSETENTHSLITSLHFTGITKTVMRLTRTWMGLKTVISFIGHSCTAAKIRAVWETDVFQTEWITVMQNYSLIFELHITRTYLAFVFKFLITCSQFLKNVQQQQKPSLLNKNKRRPGMRSPNTHSSTGKHRRTSAMLSHCCVLPSTGTQTRLNVMLIHSAIKSRQHKQNQLLELNLICRFKTWIQTFYTTLHFAVNCHD
jgi:hypothetical protein